MANLRRRNGKWQVQVRRKDQAHFYRTFPTRSEALRWARETETSLDQGGHAASSATLKDMTVGDLIVRYRDTVVALKRSRKIEATILNVVLQEPFVGIRVSEVTPQPFAEYRDRRLRSVKPATVHRELGLLQHAFEVARTEWALPLRKNPLAAVRKPRLNNRRDRRLSPEERQRLLQAASSTRNKEMLPAIQLALETGLRRSELVGLRWQDIDLAARLAWIRLQRTASPEQSLYHRRQFGFWRA